MGAEYGLEAGNLMGTSKKGGLFLEVGSDVDGDLRHLCRVSVGGGHKASRASLQAELARLGLSGRPWFRPDTVTGKRKLKERSGREKWKRELQDTGFGQDRAGTLMYVCYRR